MKTAADTHRNNRLIHCSTGPLRLLFTDKMLRCILFSVVPALIFYGLSLAGLSTAGYVLTEIIRDPAQQNGQSTLIGFISSIGVWLWISSAAICFFTAMTDRSVSTSSQKELLFMAGILSMLLAIDDFIMIHDRYVNEILCYITYAIFAGVLLARHHRLISKINGYSFLLAGTLLALSILTNILPDNLPLRYS